MKRRSPLPLILILCLALTVPAAASALSGEARTAAATNDSIVVSNSSDAPDAHMVHPAVYKIEGSNYFKLRDLAMLLRGSAREFSVDYDEAAGTVSISSGRPYSPIGTELSGAAAESCAAEVSGDTVIIDGTAADLTVYKIDGANWFRLRDLGRALDFGVGYDGKTNIVYISGARGYEE